MTKKPCRCGHLKGEHRQANVRVNGRQVAVRRECQVERTRVGHIEPCDCTAYLRAWGLRG